MTEETVELTIEELEAEIERLGAEQVAREAERAEHERLALLALDTDRVAYYTDLVARGKGLDDKLEAEGRKGEAAALAALVACDMNGAFAGWCAWQRSRKIRHGVRSRVQTGADVLGVTPYTRADLSLLTGTFAEWASGQEHLTIDAGAADRIHAIVGSTPGSAD